MRTTALLLTLGVVISVGVAACSGGHHGGGSPTPTPTPGGGAMVTTRLERVGAASFAPFAAQNAAALVPGVNWSSAVTFHSIETPILSIGLALGTSGSSAPVYECGVGNDCRVDLASGAALTDLLAGAGAVSVMPGTYDHISVSTCGTSGGYQANVSAEVTMNSTIYYTSTSAGGGLSMTGPSQSIPLMFAGCARSYPLATPLVLSSGDTATLTLFFEARDLAWGAGGDATSAATWVASGCSSPSGATAPFLCMSYPDVAATVSATPPTIEHYLLNDQGTFALFFDGANHFFGGTTRAHRVDTVFPAGATIPSGMPLSIFASNGDGTFTVAEYGAFLSTNFHLTAVSASSSGTFTDYGAVSHPYTQVRQD